MIDFIFLGCTGIILGSIYYNPGMPWNAHGVQRRSHVDYERLRRSEPHGQTAQSPAIHHRCPKVSPMVTREILSCSATKQGRMLKKRTTETPEQQNGDPEHST